MTREQDINAWEALGEDSEYSFEEILPLRMLAEAIDERCAAAGVPMDDMVNSPYHPRPGQWPGIKNYLGITAKIMELLPHFIILDGMQSLDSIFIENATNRYKDYQYSNFPLYYRSEYARMVDHNCELFPDFMEGNQNRAKLNKWYAACKYWLQQMKAVNVSDKAYLSNTWTCEGGWDWERAADGSTILKRAVVNGEWIDPGPDTIDEVYQMMKLSSTNNDLTRNNVTLSSFSWYSYYNYDAEKEIDRYWDQSAYDYKTGEKYLEQSTMDCRDFPGTIRVVNPSPLSGELHLVLKPVRRLEANIVEPEITDYSTVSTDYGVDEIEVHADVIYQDVVCYVYDAVLDGSLTGMDWKSKQAFDGPQYTPRRDGISSTTTWYYYDFHGNALPKQEVEREAYKQNVTYSWYITNSYVYYAYDCGGPLSVHQHDVSVDIMNGYQIKDVEIYSGGVDKPYWWSFDELKGAIPTGWEYYQYTRGVDVDINVEQQLVAYIDYSPSYKYK